MQQYRNHKRVKWPAEKLELNKQKIRMCRNTLLPLVHGSLRKYWQHFLPKGGNARRDVHTLHSAWHVCVNSAIRWGTTNHHTSRHGFIVLLWRTRWIRNKTTTQTTLNLPSSSPRDCGSLPTMGMAAIIISVTWRGNLCHFAPNSY